MRWKAKHDKCRTEYFNGTRTITAINLGDGYVAEIDAPGMEHLETQPRPGADDAALEMLGFWLDRIAKGKAKP
jgi:hypothetical protein